jgi:hypothetical protein
MRGCCQRWRPELRGFRAAGNGERAANGERATAEPRAGGSFTAEREGLGCPNRAVLALRPARLLPSPDVVLALRAARAMGKAVGVRGVNVPLMLRCRREQSGCVPALARTTETSSSLKARIRFAQRDGSGEGAIATRGMSAARPC